MKDIPDFTTENGVASLILREIPYSEEAYIRIESSLSPEALLEECVQFCTMCGAHKIYATGHDILKQYPIHTAMLQMRVNCSDLPDTDAALFPVQEQTASQWRDIYNQRMRDVPNAAWMTEKDTKEMLQKGDGYFVHRNGELLGIGRASEDRIDVLAAVQRGAGEAVVCALCHALSENTATLVVAAENKKAMHLYKRLGFHSIGGIVWWYCVK